MRTRETMTVMLVILALTGCAPVERGCAPTEKGAMTWRDAERPLVNAHRGSRHEYDDNAAGGFRRSLAAGVRGFETGFAFMGGVYALAGVLMLISFFFTFRRDRVVE